MFWNKPIHFPVACFIKFCILGLLLEVRITGSHFVLEQPCVLSKDISAFSHSACDTKICLWVFQWHLIMVFVEMDNTCTNALINYVR